MDMVHHIKVFKVDLVINIGELALPNFALYGIIKYPSILLHRRTQRRIRRRIQLAHHHSLLQHQPAPLHGVAVLTVRATTGVEDTLIIILANLILVRCVCVFGACVCVVCVCVCVCSVRVCV